MKILIAPDKFKGVSTAQEISQLMRNLIQKCVPQAQLRLCPMADGGEGTLNSIIYMLKGKTLSATVFDPLMRAKQVQFGMAQLPEKDTALIEMAQASGLFRLAPEERNPMETTTYGTGELVLEAIKHGAVHIKIALGGSATVDGGLGFLHALGAIPKSKTTLPKGLTGKHLDSILSLDLEPAIQKLKGISLTSLVDVHVPLLGDHGAARMFGPQKGATPEMVETLEKGLYHFEEVLAKSSGYLLKNNPGAGSAGGLGMAILALGGRLESGFKFVSQNLKLEDQMKGCDLVITGEGKLDASSREGKVPISVARVAKKAGVPCYAIVGALDVNGEWYKEEGIVRVFPLFDSAFVENDPRKELFQQKMAETITMIFSKKTANT